MGEINVKSASEILDDTLQRRTAKLLFKGKKLGEGTIRTHGGKKVQKKGGKWLPVSEGKQKKVEGKTQVSKEEEAVSDNVKKAIRKMATGTISAAQIAKKMALSEIQVNKILGKKGPSAKTQVPKGEQGGRAQPKTTDEAKVMAASAVKRLKDGGKIRGGDRVTQQAQKDGIVDEDGKVTAKGDKYLGKQGVQKPSQIKKRKKQVKDTRDVTQVLSAAISSIAEGKKIYQHKLTRDQRRSYDGIVKAGHAEWKKEANGDRYLDVTSLGHVQYVVSSLGAKLAADPTNKETEKAFVTMTKEYSKMKSAKERKALKEMYEGFPHGRTGPLNVGRRGPKR